MWKNPGGTSILAHLDLPDARYTLGSPGANHRNSMRNMNPPTAISGKLR